MMNSGLFEVLLEQRIVSIRNTLASKGREYSAGDDMFHNFRVAAKVNNTNIEKALWGMALKHLVSVMDMIEQSDVVIPRAETVNEKIGDLINYLILLEIRFKTIKIDQEVSNERGQTNHI